MESEQNDKRKKSVRWFASGWGSLVFALIVLVVFQLFPAFADFVYRGFIYPLFRIFWDYTLGLLPFPLIWLVLIGIPIAIAYRIHKARQTGRSALWLVSGKIASWVAAFFWMWGYHYSCSDLMTYTPVSLTLEEYVSWAEEQTSRAAALRTLAENELQRKPDVTRIRRAVKDKLQEYGWRTPGRPGAHALNDGGFIRRLGIGGIYIPYAGEGYTSNTFHPIEQHFILAHELSHAFGVTHEGEADFVAWRTLAEDSSSHVHQYAAELQLLRHLRGIVKRADEEAWKKLAQQTPKDLQRDLSMLRLDAARYAEYQPGLGEKVNDKYLRLMGDADGVNSYDLFVDMVAAMRR
ncbi:MAG: DUF3810 family protein [Flavobacteriales bacterium]|jgi:hypothetical protein